MNEFLAITNALADENRVRVLLALRGGELCVCQIIELLQLAPSTVSKHVSILKQAGLVDGRKEGRWMYYRLAAEEAGSLVARTLAWVRDALAKEERAREDVRRLCLIVKENPEDLCKKQAERSKCCSSARETRAEVRWRKAGLGA